MLTRRALLTSAGAVLVARPARAWSGARAEPAVDGGRLRRRIEALSTFGRPAGGTFASGVSRVAYSEADVAARAWLIEEIRAAGFTPRLDPAGNVFVRVGEGSRAANPLRLAHRLGAWRRQLRRRPRHAVGTRSAAGRPGSRPRNPPPARDGAVGPRREHGLRQGHRVQPDRGRRSEGRRSSSRSGTGCGAPRRCAVSAATQRGSRRRCAGAAPGMPTWSCTSNRAARSIAARVPIGIVEGIVAIHRYDVVVDGMANHAGTTPMDGRQDALVAASRLVLAVREMAAGAPGTAGGHRRPARGRAELAQRRARPGDPERRVPRPGRRRRSTSWRRRRGRAAAAIARETGTTITMTLATSNPPALAHAGVQDAIGGAAERLGLIRAATAERCRPRRADDRCALPDGHDLRAERRRHQPLAARAHLVGGLHARRGRCCWQTVLALDARDSV